MPHTPKEIIAEIKKFDSDIKSMRINRDMYSWEKQDYLDERTKLILPMCHELTVACKKNFLSFFNESTEKTIYLNDDLKYLLFFSLDYSFFGMFKTLLEGAEQFTSKKDYALRNHFNLIRRREIDGKKIRIENSWELDHYEHGSLMDYDSHPLPAYLTVSDSFFGLVNLVESKKNNSLINIAASKKGSTSIVNLLIEKGADVNNGDENGYTPITTAIREGNPSLARIILLKSKRIIPECTLHSFFSFISVTQEDLSIFETLLDMARDKGKNIDPEYNSDRKKFPEYLTSLLHQSIYRDADPEIIKLLLANKPDLNGQDSRDGYTALHFAVNSDANYLDTVKLLVEHGADVNVRTRYGDTPLHLLSQSGDTSTECRRIARYLLRNGADPFIENNEGLNVFEVAKEIGSCTIDASQTLEVEIAKRKYPNFEINDTYFIAKTPGYAHYIPIWYRKARSSVENNQIEEVLTETAMIQAPKNISGNKPKLDGGPGL